MTETTINGVRVVVCPAEGSELARDTDATDLIGELWGRDADMLVIPMARFADEFFVLSTKVAGEIVQKFVNYGVRLTVVGDMSTHVGASSAMAAFVAESNRGRHLWFVSTLDELTLRLNSA